MGERRGTNRVLAGRPEGKTPLRITRRRWEYNIKKNLQEVGEGSRDRTGRTYGRYSTCGEACECSNQTLSSIKFWEFLD